MPKYELIDHTADIGIRISARDRSTLFSRAAWALFDLIGDLEAVEVRSEDQVSLQSPELETLMVMWLNELIYRHETAGLLAREFDVTIRDGFSLTARIGGETIDVARHEIFRNIKAATYHQLEVKQAKGWWHAQIIFDV